MTNTNKTKPCCRDCKFYCKQLCVRFPPVFVEKETYGRFPFIRNAALTWCGEWTHKND